MLILPVLLLILLGLVGLRGAPTPARWDGPLRHDSLIIGIALEVILAVLLTAMIRRRASALRSAAPRDDVAAKLRGVLIVVLAAAMIGVAVGYDDLHIVPHQAPLHLPPLPPSKHQVTPKAPPSHPAGFHLPLTAILYGLLIVVLVAAALFSVWWLRRAGRPAGREPGGLAEDGAGPADLREAVGSGRAALRSVDDARGAIIACYLAMETSLAERGTARAVADTPDELLARATASGLVHGRASPRLTALFYEARFSSHPLGRAQRDAAEQALDELAAALAARAGAEAGR